MSVGLACISMVVALMTILPWTIRNYIVMGEPVLTSTNGGIVFLIGNGPGSTGIHRNIPADTFSDASELTVYRESYKLALIHMANNPVEWISVLPRKFFHLWASDWSGVAYSTLPRGYHADLVTLPMLVAQASWVITAIAAAVAVWTRPIRDYWLKFPVILISLTLTYWTAFHLLFQGEGRYHMQVIPLIVIIALHLPMRDRNWRAWLTSSSSPPYNPPPKH